MFTILKNQSTNVKIIILTSYFFLSKEWKSNHLSIILFIEIHIVEAGILKITYKSNLTFSFLFISLFKKWFVYSNDVLVALKRWYGRFYAITLLFNTQKKNNNLWQYSQANFCSKIKILIPVGKKVLIYVLGLSFNKMEINLFN